MPFRSKVISHNINELTQAMLPGRPQGSPLPYTKRPTRPVYGGGRACLALEAWLKLTPVGHPLPLRRHSRLMIEGGGPEASTNLTKLCVTSLEKCESVHIYCWVSLLYLRWLCSYNIVHFEISLLLCPF